jgi:hypothetical protein
VAESSVTLFEILSVAISIVLALSAGQLLTNFREIFDPGRRCWTHATWVVHLLLVHVLTWWSLWAFREVPWNLATFSLILLPPATLFVCSSTLVPNNASSVASWKEHFFQVRGWFFAVRSLFIVAAGFRSWFLLDTPVLETPSRVSIPMLVLCLSGLFVPSERFHGALAGVAMALLWVVSILRLEAGAQ